MSQLATISPKPPLAIRSAVERGWAAFSHCPWVLMGFTLLSGGANLAAQLLYRYESSLVLSLLGKPDPVAKEEPAAVTAEPPPPVESSRRRRATAHRGSSRWAPSSPRPGSPTR